MSEQNQSLNPTHYSSYLQLPSLLNCQQPLTSSQDENFFILVHQICELTFQQMISDMKRTLNAISLALQDQTDSIISDLSEAYYFLSRLLQLYEVVTNTTSTLKTMRGFAEFRTQLGSMSGFQSFQFRHLEIMSGVGRYWDNHTEDKDDYDSLIEQWLEDYRHHNLVHYYHLLLDRIPGNLPSEKLTKLLKHKYAHALLRQMGDYEIRQNQFHQAHLELATQQLQKIGVKKGTGGTCCQNYLTRYQKKYRILFPGLAESLSSSWLN